MCDTCATLLPLLASKGDQLINNETPELQFVDKNDAFVYFTYVSTWSQRQCNCCFRDPKNFERMAAFTQCLLHQTIVFLREYHLRFAPLESSKESELQKSQEENHWDLNDLEKLLQFVAKALLLNFPLYLAYKHSVQAKLEEINELEAARLNVYCDIHELEISIHLLRNVCLFCKSGGIHAITACFDSQTPECLPINIAHAFVAVATNLKLWLNFRSLQLFIPLRSAVLRYMCKLADKDLRSPGIKYMAEFTWGAVKELVDTHTGFDKDGLDLAFKYFISSTLTMRLAGIAQINNHVGIFNELCNSDNVVEAENLGHLLAKWLIDHKIVDHIFGPNLHVEVIKQSHIILNFLAMEGKLSTEHVEIMWAAAQLKHCGRQVYDLLPSLIRHLEPGPVIHLYHLLSQLPTCDHTEQSLFLASSLVKFIWTNASNCRYGLNDAALLLDLPFSNRQRISHPFSSMENSGSGEESAEEQRNPCRLGPTTRVKERLGTRTRSPGKKTRQKSRPEQQSSDDEDMGGEEEQDDEEEEDEEDVEEEEEEEEDLTDSQGGDTVGEEAEDERSDEENLQVLWSKTALTHNIAAQLVLQEEALIPPLSMLPPKPLSVDEPRTDGTLSSASSPRKRRLPDSSESESGAVKGKKEKESDSEETFKKPLEQSIADSIMDSDKEGSYSSRTSTKSEKNMADFDGEESGCDDELAQLAACAANPLGNAHPKQIASMVASFYQSRLEAAGALATPSVAYRQRIQKFPEFRLEAVCQPGHTLLWDLLQDEKIAELGEGLALEAEKSLCNLLCFTSDPAIRIKFIEGCLENLAKNKAVMVALRLLPKLFASFAQMRSPDTHRITLWADQEYDMVDRFFQSLELFAVTGPTLPIYNHQMEVHVRLQFLSAIYSSIGTPDSFRLSLTQLGCLWQCLASHPQSSDQLFAWLLSQVKRKDQHALGPATFRHLFLELLPQLPAEQFSMTALALFQQLLASAKATGGAGMDLKSSSSTEAAAMNQLWAIALRAVNTDVSSAAIQNLNGFYLSWQLEQEEEFVSRVLESLQTSWQELQETTNPEAILLRVQRALLLLLSHLETFKKKYAYQLRRWALEGRGLSSHAQLAGEKGGATLRIILQAASKNFRDVLELASTDLVADLRAETAVWWEALTAGQARESEGSLRLLTQGQELAPEYDDRSLQEIGFKDGHIVFVSVGAARGQKRKESVNGASSVNLPRDKLPSVILLRTPYFEQLFSLMQTLSSLTSVDKHGHKVPYTKAQVLSRRVWDILMLLPTNPARLQGLQNLEDSNWKKWLDPACPQKLMYSLYIVEALAKAESDKKSWKTRFIQSGGLKHLFDIFLSGQLQHGGTTSEWQQDALAHLLKILCQLGMVDTLANAQELEVANNEAKTSNNGETGRESPKKSVRHLVQDRLLLIPKLTQELAELMSSETVMKSLSSILHEASFPQDLHHYKTGFWGQTQVVHYALALLVSWVHSSEEVWPLFVESLPLWATRLVLLHPEPMVRRETCSALYRLCIGQSAASWAWLAEGNGSKDGHREDPASRSLTSVAVPLLAHLLDALPTARTMPMHKLDQQDEGKEPYGPACRDYFWFLCRLVEGLDEEFVKRSYQEGSAGLVDLNELAGCVAKAVVTRECLESRHGTVEDEGLLGLLNLATAIFKHNPPFRTSPDGQEFMSDVFQCLFALPHAKQRYLPRCKSRASRSAAYDLLVECVKGSASNYRKLHAMLLSQHQAVSGQSYPWDYWPHEDGRSDCGYVGLTNLGATCYMASCMQHLYMMPQARNSILQAQCSGESRHAATLCELQRMFAYLMESERKAYNPRSFCKVYTMDHQPLNTGEQKDMAEFFIDLVSKLEEMTPELKTLVKNLFCGVISNNVVSLDCNHVSRTIEEFYTVRCQVADMRNLYESLDEVTVKDTLEGDNMYTCSQCGKKVRAEKRACFKKLPHILCFNTMRYTFNMVTMTKEKVNTHFSFPLHLDMSGYVEKNLMPQQYQEEKAKEELGEAVAGEEYEEYQYDLIGVTVHTGTADGGHYYSFIRDRTASKMENWYLFNDAEVKPFDKNQIAAECFGGEMTSKTYDSVTDKFMDFSFEKTNSAYMLFYERSKKNVGEGGSKTSNEEPAESAGNDTKSLVTQPDATLELSQELEEWIWQDNVHFLRDRNVFDHAYFSFMWQMCGYVPQTLTPSTEESTKMDITLMSAQLSTSFFLETFIHAKEKPTMVQWVELLTKQFNASRAACEWFMDSMAGDPRWPIHILLKCPNQMVRQMFQRLCIHVIQRLRPQHAQHYLANSASSQQGDEAGSQDDSSTSQELPSREPGSQSCVTRFVKKLLSLMSNGAKAHLKHLNEYFTFLYDFARMGEEECRFLNSVHAISIMVNFYLGQKSQEMLEAASDEEEEEEDERAEEEVVTVPDKVRPTSLDKMVHLIAHLVEKSRGEDQRLHLSNVDMNAVAGGKGFPFLYQQIKDNISLKQTRNLIFSLCRFSDHLAAHIVNMLFQSVTRHSELSGPFFKLLSELVELGGGPPGLPCFTQLVLQRVWEVAEVCPASTLDWLAQHVPRSRLIQAFCLQGLEVWLEPFLLQHNTHRVRAAAAFLVISLVPSLPFRQSFSRTWSGSGSGLMVGLGPAGSLARGGTSPSPHKEINLNPDVRAVLQQVFGALLRLLKRAKTYTDLDTHGIAKLTAYFAVMTHCLVSKLEKLMFRPFFMDLWTLFHPRLSEPAIPVHHNKQALLLFWHQLCVDCPENVALIMQNPTVLRNIAFNYILADHEDQDVVHFNRIMLPAYYGLLRLCCQQSRTFTRQLASHQNVQWAFKNITPYSTQYSAAIEELLKLMQMFVAVRQDTTEQEMQEIITFKRQTMQMYLQVLDGRSCWATLIPAFRILVSSFDDWLFVIFSGGLPTFFEAFHTLHVMYYEATACHVVGDLQEILSLILDLLKTVRAHKDSLKEKQDKEAGTGANQNTNASSASSSASSSTSGTIPGSTSIVANAKEGDEDQNKREKERDARQALLACRERPETIRKIATLLNSYSSPEMRQTCLDILKEWLLLIPSEVLSTLVPLLTHSHSCLQDTCGPYFPTRSKAKAFASPASVLGFGPKAGPTRLGLTGVGGALRPQRPVVQMTLNRSLMEVPKGVDEDYDRALGEYFLPYHQLVDVMCRVAVNHDLMTEALVCLSTTLGREAVLLHFTLFHKFWLDVYQAQHVDRKYLAMLLSNKGLLEAMEAVLKEERVLLNNSIVHNFFSIFLVKVHTPLLSEPFRRLISRLVSSLEAMAATLDVRSPVCVRQLNGDLQALMLVYSTAPLQVPLAPPSPSLVAALQTLLNRAKAVAEKTELPDKAPEEPLSKKARVSGSEGENEATAPRLENNSNPTVADKPANEGSEGKGEVSSSEEEAPPPEPETKESSSKDSSGKPEANTYYAESLVKIIEQLLVVLQKRSGKST